MIIVIDSGSTKADWIVVPSDGSEQYLVSTMGFNPFFHDEDRIVEELSKDFVNHVPVAQIEKVFFYGAGCSDEAHCQIIHRGLERIFTKSVIYVEHDLLASARATCGNSPGIACIIGTGSNTCSYDGKKITDNVTNLGYLVGDEGSGSWLGKLLVRSYFYREMPNDLKLVFEEEYGSGEEARLKIINQIYGDAPNVYLASFAKFMVENKEHSLINSLVFNAFDELVCRHVLKYENHAQVPIHFVGSIAFHLQDILKNVLEKRGLTLGNVIRKPVENLVNYHLSNN